MQTLSCSEGLWGYAPTGACSALTAGMWQAEWEAEAARAVSRDAHARQAAVSRGAEATDPAGELRRDELSPSQARRQAVFCSRQYCFLQEQLAPPQRVMVV